MLGLQGLIEISPRTLRASGSAPAKLLPSRSHCRQGLGVWGLRVLHMLSEIVLSETRNPKALKS